MVEGNAADAKLEEICAFVDTNILIHFEFLNEIDWPRVLGAKRVCLAFSPIIITELGDIKDAMTMPGRREKVRRVLKVIDERLESADLDTPVPLPGRANTSIMYISEDDLSIDPTLRQEKQDDHLMAALLNYRKVNPDANVLLLSDDLNCRQRAKRFGITARTLPEDFRRPLPLTEEEEELKKLRAVEPQVEVEFGAEGNDLLLPYIERRAHREALAKSYAEQIKKVFAKIEQEFEHVWGEYGYDSKRRAGLPQFLPLDIGELSTYSPVDLAVITAAKQLDLNLLVGHIEPEPRLKASWDSLPLHVQEPFDLWKSNLNHLRQLARERETKLFYADQNLKYFELPLSLIQVGGNGVQDGQVVLTLDGPISFITTKPLAQADWDKPQPLFKTQWRDKPERPSSTTETPQTKIFSFGNLHPGITIKCDPLYIFTDSAAELADSDEPMRLTVEVSGLNIRLRSPHNKVVAIRFA